MRVRRNERGFSLLEAVVALVILALAGMALFDWVNASVQSLRRVESANARNEATANAIEYMQSVNPMLRPQGQMEFGNYRIAWEAENITDVTDGSHYPRGRSLYQLALYETVVRAYQQSSGDGALWFEFRMKQVGYKKVRELISIGAPTL